MATLIKTNGLKITITGSGHRGKFTLEELQKLVDGRIEFIVSRVKGTRLIVNEDGKSKGLPFNQQATEYYKHNDIDSVVGDAILIEDSELDA